jgi:membrane protein
MNSEPTVDQNAEANADQRTPRPLPRKIHQLRWRTWRGVLWRSATGYIEDDCSDFAAAMTYQTVTALIPSLVVIVALINLVTDGSTVLTATIGILRHLGLGAVVDNPALLDVVQSLLVQQTPAKVLLGFGLLLALWSASGYVGTFTRASNRIYGVAEGRQWWLLEIVQVALAAVALVLLAAGGAGLVISGPLVDALGDQLGAGATARWLWSVGRWPVLVAIAVALLSLLFWIAPNVRQPRFRWLTVGGAVALLAWTLVSFGFGLYVANFGSYNRTYGSLGAIMAFLVWVYLSNISLLLGVQVNAEVQRGRLLQAGNVDASAPLATRLAADPPGTSRNMSTVTEHVDVEVPVRTAYNQWTQFEEFPRFMEGVQEIRQLDATHTYWKTEIAGVKREFSAEITEQLPDERVAWKSTEGEKQAGVVTFHRLDDTHTRVTVQMDYDPQGFVENAGDKLGVVDRRVKGDLKRFKEYIEGREVESGSWRGQVDRPGA